MKGMMNLLEKAGLVRKEDESNAADAATGEGTAASEALSPSNDTEAATVAASGQSAFGLTLSQIYESAAIAPSAYPAERLLRLLDGLKAMDEGLRRQTIQAIDSADDSWTINDPISDATAKIAALERHASSINAMVETAERDTEALLVELRNRQGASVTEIRRQIKELEGLLAREISRGTQDAATIEAGLKAKKDDAKRELESLARASNELRQLVMQFQVNTTKSE
jgi:small-conductance mechanosensitive channel